MISVAIQRGNSVYVYNEKNQTIAIKSGTLAGYTSSTFSIIQGRTVYTYNEKNQTISVKSC